MVAKKMLELGRYRSVIREIHEHAVLRSAQIGAENVFDFSIGNPSVPVPQAVTDTLQQLIAEHKLEDKVSLGGTFCLSNCQKGVCVTVDDVLFSVTPETVNEFFQENVLAKV